MRSRWARGRGERSLTQPSSSSQALQRHQDAIDLDDRVARQRSRGGRRELCDHVVEVLEQVVCSELDLLWCHCAARYRHAMSPSGEVAGSRRTRTSARETEPRPSVHVSRCSPVRIRPGFRHRLGPIDGKADDRSARVRATFVGAEFTVSAIDFDDERRGLTASVHPRGPHIHRLTPRLVECLASSPWSTGPGCARSARALIATRPLSPTAQSPGPAPAYDAGSIARREPCRP